MSLRLQLKEISENGDNIVLEDQEDAAEEAAPKSNDETNPSSPDGSGVHGPVETPDVEAAGCEFPLEDSVLKKKRSADLHRIVAASKEHEPFSSMSDAKVGQGYLAMAATKFPRQSFMEASAFKALFNLRSLNGGAAEPALEAFSSFRDFFQLVSLTFTFVFIPPEAMKNIWGPIVHLLNFDLVAFLISVEVDVSVGSLGLLLYIIPLLVMFLLCFILTYIIHKTNSGMASIEMDNNEYIIRSPSSSSSSSSASSTAGPSDGVEKRKQLERENRKIRLCLLALSTLYLPISQASVEIIFCSYRLYNIYEGECEAGMLFLALPALGFITFLFPLNVVRIINKNLPKKPEYDRSGNRMSNYTKEQYMRDLSKISKTNPAATLFNSYRRSMAYYSVWVSVLKLFLVIVSVILSSNAWYGYTFDDELPLPSPLSENSGSASSSSISSVALHSSANSSSQGASDVPSSFRRALQAAPNDTNNIVRCSIIFSLLAGFAILTVTSRPFLFALNNTLEILMRLIGAAISLCALGLLLVEDNSDEKISLIILFNVLLVLGLVLGVLFMIISLDKVQEKAKIARGDVVLTETTRKYSFKPLFFDVESIDWSKERKERLWMQFWDTLLKFYPDFRPHLVPNNGDINTLVDFKKIVGRLKKTTKTQEGEKGALEGKRDDCAEDQKEENQSNPGPVTDDKEKQKESQEEELIYPQSFDYADTRDTPAYLLNFRGTVGERHFENIEILADVGRAVFYRGLLPLTTAETEAITFATRCLHGRDCYWAHQGQNLDVLEKGVEAETVVGGTFGCLYIVPFPFNAYFMADAGGGKFAFNLQPETLPYLIAINCHPSIRKRRRNREILRGIAMGCQHFGRCLQLPLERQMIVSKPLPFGSQGEGGFGERDVTGKVYLSSCRLFVKQNYERPIFEETQTPITPGFEVTLEYYGGKVLEPADQQGQNCRIKGNVTILRGEEIGIYDDFRDCEKLQALFAADIDLTTWGHHKVLEQKDMFRRHYMNEFRSKQETLSYGFFTEIYDNEYVSREKMMWHLGSYEQNNAVRTLTDPKHENSSILETLVQQREYFDCCKPVALWCMFWHDVYHSNQDMQLLVENSEVRQVLDPASPDSLCWNVMSKQSTNEALQSVGLQTEKGGGFIRSSLMDQLYNAMKCAAELEEKEKPKTDNGQSDLVEDGGGGGGGTSAIEMDGQSQLPSSPNKEEKEENSSPGVFEVAAQSIYKNCLVPFVEGTEVEKESELGWMIRLGGSAQDFYRLDNPVGPPPPPPPGPREEPAGSPSLIPSTLVAPQQQPQAAMVMQQPFPFAAAGPFQPQPGMQQQQQQQPVVILQQQPQQQQQPTMVVQPPQVMHEMMMRPQQQMMMPQSVAPAMTMAPSRPPQHQQPMMVPNGVQPYQQQQQQNPNPFFPPPPFNNNN